jgi:hypothetical protein
MNAARTILLTGFFFAASVLAQEPNPYNGTWRAEFENQRGTKLEGTVLIKDQGGTWDMLTSAKNNPCVGRAAPITIQRASADELVFEIKRSQALHGCRDTQVVLKKFDAKTLEGVFDEGRKIKLVRQ